MITLTRDGKIKHVSNEDNIRFLKAVGWVVAGEKEEPKPKAKPKKKG
jgi:hypothetical protein